MDDVHTIQPYIHSDDAEKQARLLMERFRWPDGKPCCPVCGSKRPIYRQVRRGVEGYYRCQTPLRWGKYHSKPIVFSIRTGTIMRSEEHTSELQSLMRNSNAVF